MIPQYIQALCQEIHWVGQREGINASIDTIFFGGGTPTMLSPAQLGSILQWVRQNFTVREGGEITLEANPGTVSRDSLQELFSAGFNRISFGMQSAHPQDLRTLDRAHQFEDVLSAVTWSRQAGFRHINVDLIFGIPGQTMERWQTTLKLAGDLGIDHLSLYSLILEEGTPLHRWYGRGLVDLLDDDLIADMYEWAAEFLDQQGFKHYEISNWARENRDGSDGRCLHNLHTWQFHPYFGFGAGAHGFVGQARTENADQIRDYLNKMNLPQGDWPAAELVTVLSTWEQMQEWMMVGLRMVEDGVSRSAFTARFGMDLEDVFGDQLEKLLKSGLLENHPENGDCIRLTKKGTLLGNRVFIEFVGNEPPQKLSQNQ